MNHPATRSEALARLHEFLPNIPRYAGSRNHVWPPEHPGVSRLSPAIRHRLVTEMEVASLAIENFPPQRCEKFVQEVLWRVYWKGWLERHPSAWTTAKVDPACFSEEILTHADAISAGRSGCAVMDAFARELIETGYLHNHARMWFASFWIHVRGLPWELGAAFFYRHLLDGDPASNTLSWRWVAGLQTPGKTYLVRRSNLERYLPPAWLDLHSAGLSELDDGKITAITPETRLHAAQPFPEPPPPLANPLPEGTGWWIHEEDLHPETLLRDANAPAAAIVSGNPQAWAEWGFPPTKTAFLHRALSDTAERIATTFPTSTCALNLEEPLPHTLLNWAQKNKLHRLIHSEIPVGPLRDQLPKIKQTLSKNGIEIQAIRRPEDNEILSLAGTGGFFGFWKKCQKRLPWR